MTSAITQTITVGVTGASGAIFAQKTLALLEDDPRVARVHLVVSETGQRLFAEELDITSGDLRQLPAAFSAAPRTKSKPSPTRMLAHPSLPAVTMWTP